MQFKGMNLCDFCFEPIGLGNVCTKCGLSHEKYQAEAGLLPPGTILVGKYVIGKVLGRGGFGATYLAYSNELNRTVAIKEYLPISIAYRGKDEGNVTIVSDEKRAVFDKGAKRFFEEAKTISRFNKNDNIVSVYEFFYANNTVYYSMELLDGVDLKKYIANNGGKLPEAEVVNILKSLCNALIVVHSTQTLHRDISPDNIFMCSNGKVKLIDFGTAKQVISDESQSYSVVVKQGFAPSEQYSKKGKQGVGTDIYAVGATMYFALTGKVPPDAIERVENPYLIIDADNISQETIAIINKCMQIKSAERYQSAIELLGDLEKVQIRKEEVPKNEWHNQEQVIVSEKIENETLNLNNKKNIKTKKQKKEKNQETSKKAVHKRIDITKNNQKKPIAKNKKDRKKTLSDWKVIFDKKAIMISTLCGLAACVALAIGIAVVYDADKSKFETSTDITEYYEDESVVVVVDGTSVTLHHPVGVNGGNYMISDVDVFGMLGINYINENGIINGSYKNKNFTINTSGKKVLNAGTNVAESTANNNLNVSTVNDEGVLMLPVTDVMTFLEVYVVCDKAGGVIKVSTYTEADTEEISCGENTDENETEILTCLECGSTEHTTHPQKKPSKTPSKDTKCPTCGSTSHTTHPQEKPKCSVCGSTSHTTHPKPAPTSKSEKVKCKVCGSTDHTSHPTKSPSSIERNSKEDNSLNSKTSASSQHTEKGTTQTIIIPPEAGNMDAPNIKVKFD